MRAAGWLAILAISALLLAGCSNPGNGDPATPVSTHSRNPPGPLPPTPAPSISYEPGATVTPAPNGPNHAPLAVLTAPRTAGEAPVILTFNLSASDADHNRMAWTFDADGDGSPDASGADADSVMPLQTSFRYVLGGTFHANLTVTDGRTATSATIAVKIEPTYLKPLQDETGTYIAGLPDSCLASSNVPGGGFEFIVNEPSWGHPYYAYYNTTAPAVAYRVVFYDAGGVQIGDESVKPDPGTLFIQGMVPANAITAVVTSCGGAQADVHYFVPAAPRLPHSTRYGDFVAGSPYACGVETPSPAPAPPEPANTTLALGLAPGSAGRSFVADFSFTTPVAQPMLRFVDGSAGVLGSPLTNVGLHIYGAVPEGAVAVLASACGSGPASVVITVL